MILSRKRSDRRDRRFCRFGVMLVVCSLLVNMVCVPKAKAVVIDATAAFGAAAATAAINGTTATTLFTGMTTSAATSAMTGLMGEYAVATGAASSGTALAASIGAGTVITAAGAIVLTAAAAFAVYKFIEWLREEKGLEAGGDPVVVVHEGGFNGTAGFLPVDIVSGGGESLYETGPITWYPMGTTVGPVTSTDTYNYTISYDGHAVCTGSGFNYFAIIYNTDNPSYILYPVGNWVGVSTDFPLGVDYRGIGSSSISTLAEYGMSSTLSEDELCLQPNSTLQTIPQEIPDGQSMVISGIENLPQDDPQAAVDLIMQTAIDGNLAPTVSVEADPTVTPDPEPDPTPDPDPDAPELPSNLGDLGAALTTRFPFSIPWDIARAIKLIAAPAQAPYWEVDFLAPMAHWVGGFSGSTKVVLDFGKPEYEIIGIASRWTSTIGFCLALAAATKRFIWTA